MYDHCVFITLQTFILTKILKDFWKKHKLALFIKHLVNAFPVLEDVDSILLAVWKLFHYSPKKYGIFKEIQAAYGMKKPKMIRAAATRWLSHGRACQRLLDRFVQVYFTLCPLAPKTLCEEVSIYLWKDGGSTQTE